MKAKICNYKNNAKAAFTFVFDDGCYGESTMWTYEIFKSIFEKTGLKIKATSAQTVGFISPGAKKMWDSLFEEGYYDLCAHSLDHCIGYNKNTSMAQLHKDACESREKLEEMYPSMRALTFATPGGGSDSFGWDILKCYYIANRNGNDRINIPRNIDWYDIGTFTAMLNRTSKDYTDSIDETIKNGGWSVQVNHWITKKAEDKFHSQAYDTFVDQCEYLGKKAKENEIWVASLNEATLYLQEAEKSTLEITEEEGKTKITLNCPLNIRIYNYPLTVEIEENGKTRYIDIMPNETVIL